jgi:prephenate dehydrogenase
LVGSDVHEEPAASGAAATSAAARAEAAARLPSRIAYLGFGLIGGSIAAALRSAGGRGTRMTAWTPAGVGPAEGLRRGLVDERAHDPAAAIDGAELIVLAGPPLAIVRSLGRDTEALRAAASAGATITDVGSTKRRILDAAADAGLPFVGGHPMAGRETTGAASASADLFIDRPWVVVPGEGSRPDDVERVEALARATGARPVRLDAAEHDAAVAAISHLPLVVAAALVEAVTRDAGRGNKAADWPLARSLSATGWSDMTRLARGDPEMGAGILATNSVAVADRLRALRSVLDGWIERLDREATAAQLRDQLDAARRSLLDETSE